MMCHTLRCGLRATFRLVWDDGGDVELCCDHHAGHFGGQPYIMSRATLEAMRSY